ncbi:hypothetical protein VTJ04DRAFT_1236 [Mycothermus thermophilus]|uniref:uncharacterized protein n=1 Tax=Humicola insolens TaxID=85995 RepID=UPI003742148A
MDLKPSNRPLSPRRPKTTIEIPLHSIRKYVPGSIPPPRISLVPPRDSTAYIIDKLVLQTDESMNNTARRLAYYHIGFTDAPAVKILVPCHKALDYVSPWEMEDWEYSESERKEEERARELVEAQARPVKKPGCPPKAAAAEAEIEDESMSSSAEEALLLAQEAEGPSLSTPQKRRLDQFYEGEEGEIHTDSDEIAGHLQLAGDAEGEYDSMDYESEMEEEDLESEDPLALDEGNLDDGDSDAPWRTKTFPGRDTSSFSGVTPPLEQISRGSVSGISIPESNAPSPSAIHPDWARSFSQSQLAQPKQNGTEQPGSGVHSSSKVTPIPPPKVTPIPPPKVTPILPPVVPVQTFRATNTANGVTALSTPTVSTSQKVSSPTPSTVTATKRKAPSNGASSPSETPSQTQKKPKKQKPQKQAPPEPEPEDDEWEVKELLADEWIVQNGVKVHRYLVLWKGDWPEDQNPTWEPAENVLDRDLIKEYERKKREGLLKPYRKPSPKKNAKGGASSKLWPPATKYSSVAEAFAAGIDDETAPAPAEGESDEADNEMLLVTENPAQLTTPNGGRAKTQATSPLFRSFDSSMARYQQTFSRG